MKTYTHSALLLLLLLFPLADFAQSLQTGRITFSESPQPTPGLQTYRLTPNSNLYFTAKFRHPLTDELQHLAPGMNPDELAKTSNFQFSLLLDGHLIYSSNLLPGAPSRGVRDTATLLSKPLIDNIREQGLWSESFWGRFLRSGGDSALTEGPHLLRMEIRPYVTADARTVVGQLMAAGDLQIQVALQPAFDLDTIKLSKVTAYNGLSVSHASFDHNQIKRLKGMIRAGVFKHISSVVVLKNGKLLTEEYFNGETRDSLHDPRSVGKSFASTMTGIAIHDGYLKSQRQTLQDFYNLTSYANPSPLKDSTRLCDLLTMSSAFDGNDDDGSTPGNEENMYPTANWVKFALDLPARQQNGQWHYFTAGVVLLGDILNQSVPGGLAQYADQKLFAPLGIRNYQWQYTPQPVPNTAGGIRMNALDFAKYGQLYQDNGRWNGKQLIPAEWIAKTFTKQKALPGRNHEYYGYLFWNKTYHVNGKAYETWYCSGNGGNSIFIFKDQPLVIVVTATAYGQVYAHTQVDKIMEQYILPAVAGY